jgi:hypothetical protein
MNHVVISTREKSSRVPEIISGPAKISRFDIFNALPLATSPEDYLALFLWNLTQAQLLE